MGQARDPLARMLRVGTPVFLGYTVLAVLIGRAYAGSWGSFGAIFGSLVPFVFFSITTLTAVLARRMSPGNFTLALLAAWLPKMILLLAFLSWFQGQDWYDKGVFLVTLLLGSTLLLTMEGWLVLRTPQYYTHD